ncbi:MAG: hypothetical protein LBM06_01780 [Prevotellaceae bacterium]|jgi:hypothetical protein|nr:hypothetical protein [Prevotellaceae bacterium]
MKKFILTICLLVAATAAQAQFEKGKWIINPSLTGLGFSYDTHSEKANFGFQGQAGLFIANDIALMANATSSWRSEVDIYSLGLGARYYFSKVGIYLGAIANVNRNDYAAGIKDHADFSCELHVGYAYFVSRTVTIEPAVYWNIKEEGSDLGLKVGFGFYF